MALAVLALLAFNWSGDAAKRAFESAGEKVDDSPGIVPALLALVGSASVPAAQGVAEKWSQVAAWLFTAVVAFVTFLGAILATRGAKKGATGKTWTGIVILVVPFGVLVAGAIAFWGSWWRSYQAFSALDKGLLFAGVIVYAVGIITGVYLLLSKWRENKSPKAAALAPMLP